MSLDKMLAVCYLPELVSVTSSDSYPSKQAMLLDLQRTYVYVHTEQRH